MGLECVDWMHLSQGSVQWLAVLNQEYKAFVRLVWQSHPVFTPTVICTYSLTTLRQYVHNYMVSFTTTLLVLFYWLLSLILLYILLFYAIRFYCKHLWDPKHVHCYLIYLSYYGSVWPEDGFFKSKLVASLHIDNKLMCFRLILFLSN
jgi:hypothetical protein